MTTSGRDLLSDTDGIPSEGGGGAHGARSDCVDDSVDSRNDVGHFQMSGLSEFWMGTPVLIYPVSAGRGCCIERMERLDMCLVYLGDQGNEVNPLVFYLWECRFGLSNFVCRCCLI